jgi:DNA-binding transcriptional MerR regulator
MTTQLILDEEELRRKLELWQAIQKIEEIKEALEGKPVFRLPPAPSPDPWLSLLLYVLDRDALAELAREQIDVQLEQIDHQIAEFERVKARYRRIKEVFETA